MFRERVGRGRRGAFACILVVAMHLLTARADADDIDPSARSAARSLGYAGVDAFERREWFRFGQARESVHRPEGSLDWIVVGACARSARTPGPGVRTLSSRRNVAHVRRRNRRAAPGPADAARELGELLPRIPSIVVVVDGGGTHAGDGGRLDRAVVARGARRCLSTRVRIGSSLVAATRRHRPT